MVRALRVGESHHPNATTDAEIGGDRSVRTDGDAGFLGVDLDRPTLALDGIAVAGDEVALRVGLERTVAGVAVAGRSADHEERLAAHGHMQRIAGLLDRPLGEVEGRALVR